MCNAAKMAPIMFWVFNFSAFMTFWLLILTITQTYQIVRNLTTNELSNYARLEYFYPQLQPEDVEFEKIKDSDKSKRFINVFDYGFVANWLDFWKHPLNRIHNLNVMESFTEEDLRHARIKKLKRKIISKSNITKHERSASATSVPLIKNILNIKRECCPGHHRESNTIHHNSSKNNLLKGMDMV